MAEPKVIICRFRNEYDLLEFRKRTGIKVDPSMTEYNIKTRKGTRKRVINKARPPQNKEYLKHWHSMPAFQSKEVKPYHMINFVFDESNHGQASEIFDQKITELTKSIWYPKLKVGDYIKKRLVGGQNNNKYPIYVISKGRYDRCYTSRYLCQMEVYHNIACEPSEADLYREHNTSKYVRVVEMDMNYKKTYDTFDEFGDSRPTGSGAVRNFVWDHSISEGHAKHWIFDDNCDEGFYYLHRNEKIRVRTGAFIRACEDLVDRYENVPLAGLNYSKFCKMNDWSPAFTINTRIYSFLLIDNSMPFRWRGRFNEDVDLSLRVMKAGFCTIQFNMLLAGKATTMRIKGGNTDEIYQDGTLEKSQMIANMHPDVAKVVWKFSRWHHEVDYRQFKQNLKLKPEYANISKETDNYGTKVIVTEEDGYSDTKTYLEEKYKHLL